jgi:hypothetical protein
MARPQHQATSVRPKSPATNAICPTMSSFVNPYGQKAHFAIAGTHPLFSR